MSNNKYINIYIHIPIFDIISKYTITPTKTNWIGLVIKYNLQNVYLGHIKEDKEEAFS